MRVIAGRLKGRRLAPVTAAGVRPTPDRVREAVFSIIAPYGPFERVLDLFAGTGALGIEAISRGAANAVFVDEDRGSLKVLKRNLDICSLGESSMVLPTDVLRAIKKLDRPGEPGFDLVFLDPPYADANAVPDTLGALAESGILNPGAVVVAETPARRGGEGQGAAPEDYGRLRVIDERRYGDTMVTIYCLEDGQGRGTDE